MKQKIQKNTVHYYNFYYGLAVLCIFLHLACSAQNRDFKSGPKPVKILPITPKFARQKGAGLKPELEARARQGFFLKFGTPTEQQETFSIMARNFNMGLNEIPTYIQNLDDIAQGTTGESGVSEGLGVQEGGSLPGYGGGDTVPMGGSGKKGDGENSSSTQSGAGLGGGNGGGAGGNTGTGGFENGTAGVGGNGVQEQKEEAVEREPEPLIIEAEKEEEKQKEPEVQKERISFAYTLEPLDNSTKLTVEEKQESDNILLSVLLRLMQISYSAQQTSIKGLWIDALGQIVDIPAGAFSIKATSKMDAMKKIKSTNGFEAIYLTLKDQLIAFVGLNDGYKKRKELRDLLGSEEHDGTLKIFIDSQLKNSSLDSLYQQLVDKDQNLLGQWLRLFEPCFFENTVTDDRTKRILETIMLNTIVARKNAGAYGQSLSIVSDNEVKAMLLFVMSQILPLVPESPVSQEVLEEPLDTEGQERSIVENKEETKKLLNKFLSKNTQDVVKKTVIMDTKNQKAQKQGVIQLPKDYVLDLYDQINRLRVNSHFEKMFDIFGQKALEAYDKDKSPLKSNTFPLMLWLFNHAQIKTATTFREMVRSQLFFNKEDQDLKTIFASMSPWNMIFDFHNLENKKHREKVYVDAYLNDELAKQSNINGIRSVVQRLRPLVQEASLGKVKELEELLKSLEITADKAIASFETIVKSENQTSKLNGFAESNLKKIVDNYIKDNEKKIAITEYLKKMKELYTKSKRPITETLYKQFEQDNEKFKYVQSFKVKPLFYDLFRMPTDLYDQFVKIAGKKSLVADIIPEDEFYNYVVPYGLLLKVLQESQSNLSMLRNSLAAMNNGVIKAKELYPDSINNSVNNKSAIQKGVYKGKLQDLLDAVAQGNSVGMRKAIDTFVTSDPINPATDSKYKDLIDTFMLNFSAQNMLLYSTMMKVLNEGSAQCPDNTSECLIGALPLEGSGVTQKEKVRNAHIYKKLAGLFNDIVTMFNPNNQPLTAEGLKHLDVEVLKKSLSETLEKIKSALEDKSIEGYWLDKNNINAERQRVVQSIEDHFNTVVTAISQLKGSVEGNNVGPSKPVESVPEGTIPPAPPHQEQAEGEGAPPPPPPPLPPL